MADFDWADVLERAAYDAPVSVILSPESIQLLLDASILMQDRFRWSAADNLEWDAIDKAISRAQDEIMVNGLIGQIRWRIGGIQPNELFCDGAIYDRVDYPDLYAVLDSAYVIDADTFRVPDLSHKSVVGEGDGWAVGDVGGAETVTLTETEMPAHTHSNTPHSHTEIIATASLINGGLEAPAAAALPAAGVTGASGVTIDSTGGDGAHENMPPYEVLTAVVVAF